MRYARSSDDVHIAYQVSGAGPLDLLLVPDGLIPLDAMTDYAGFRHFLRRLATFCRVITFDRRGIGLSDPVATTSPPTLEEWMHDAELVLDAVDSGHAALLGMAEGGFVLMMLAAKRPERVAALVLVNASPGFTAEPFRAWGLAAATLDRLEDTTEGAWGDVAWAVPVFAPSAVDDTQYHEWLKRAARRSLSPAMAATLFDVAFRTDARDLLPAINVPTLVIHRRDNKYVTADHGRYLAANISGARYVEVPGADHVPYVGDQGPILDAVEDFLGGGHRGSGADRTLATIVFTDIVQSTLTATRLGDSHWREVLVEHYELVREELAQYGGRQVETTGDGVLAIFDGPAQGVRAALAIVATVRRLGIEVRAGVHTGECELLGAGISGVAVHIAARIASLATASEVLVSRTVKDLVVGSELTFDARGEHELKGVPESWSLYAAHR